MMFVLSVVFLLCASTLLQAEQARPVLVHYMPWYASESVSGEWGWHWTMNRFNPDKVGKDGRREVASHYYPLIGAYDSNDPHVLECHVLLMKFAGIDGVVIDWYGRDAFRDYGEIHRNTLHLIKYIKRAGLRFAICYEDQAVKHKVQDRSLPEAKAVAHGKKVLGWMSENWFDDKAYLQVDGRPVLLVFGPQYYNNEQWLDMLSGLSKKPLVFGLPYDSKRVGADGAFGWPPVKGGREIPRDVWQKELRDLYARGSQGEPIMAVAFPGFRDVYREARLHDSYGSIDHRNGDTFDETLETAWKSKSQLVQIATWNDYGEGTMIEPTKEFGYRFLEKVHARTKPDSVRADDLRLPVELYELKKRFANDASAMKDLASATSLLFSMKCQEARTIIRKWQSVNSQQTE